jgi:hypothetical protein
MRQALRSIAIQATGSAATVLVALAITAQLGLSAQGQFSLLRTWNDALVTLAVLGLPQGLLQLQYRNLVPPAALQAWVLRYVCALAAIAVVAIALLPWSPWSVLALGVPLSAAHLLWRALLLRHVSKTRYAVVTAAPAVLLLAAVGVVCTLQAPQYFAQAVLFSAATSMVLSGAMLRPTAPAELAPWSRRALWSVGIESGVQNTLTALCPALLLSTVKWLGAPLEQVGIVSLGLYVYQLLAIVGTYLAPMVYDRWARTRQSPRLKVLWQEAMHHVASTLSCATRDTEDGGEDGGERRGAAHQSRTLMWICGACMLLLPMLVLALRWQWPQHLALQLALGSMAIAGALALGVRVLSALLLASGQLRPLSYQALARVVLTAGITALLAAWTGAQLAAPLALLATELVLLVWLVRILHVLGK